MSQKTIDTCHVKRFLFLNLLSLSGQSLVPLFFVWKIFEEPISGLITFSFPIWVYFFYLFLGIYHFVNFVFSTFCTNSPNIYNHNLYSVEVNITNYFPKVAFCQYWWCHRRTNFSEDPFQSSNMKVVIMGSPNCFYKTFLLKGSLTPLLLSFYGTSVVLLWCRRTFYGSTIVLLREIHISVNLGSLPLIFLDASFKVTLKNHLMHISKFVLYYWK